jgi:solute carrier family 6 amino acid transporter-like protein 5/7/9/14
MTSFVAGFAIFSVLGFMAKQIGLDVQDVATSGTGLAFVAYPDLVTKLPLPTLWAILFFLMLFTLGLDSQFAIVETLLTGVLDYYPKLRHKKTYVVAGVCIVGFLVGLPLTCPGGGYLLDLLDNYAAVWPYLFIGFTELILISWVYGYFNFIDDLVEMTNAKWLNGPVKYFLAVFYMFVSPLLIIIILLIDWASYKPFTKGDYVYPAWANGIGWFIAMFCILSVPVVMTLYLVHKWFQSGQPRDLADCKHILQESSQHTKQWRANAFKAYEKGETKSDFAYEELTDGRVVRRKGGDIRTGAGVDNKAWRKSSDLTSL